jgi:hypothetical protein
MKRFLVFALVLVFTGASAFALDLGNGLTADGEVKTGLRVATENDGDDDTQDTKAGGYNNDADVPFRTRLALGYAGDWGGAKILFQSLGFGGDASAYFTAKSAYGWVNLLDSKIVVSGGIIGDNLWGLGKLGANVFDPDLDAVGGVRAEFKLLDGLSFGAAWKVIGPNLDIDKAFPAWVFGGLYKSSLVSAAVSLGINPETDKIPAEDEVPAAPGYVGKAATEEVPARDLWIEAIAGVEVNPIDVLKVVVDLQFDSRKQEDHGETGYFRIGPLVQFSQGPLTAHAFGNIIVPNDDKGLNTADPEYKIPVDELGDPSIGFRVGAGYDLTSTINAYAQVGSDNVAYLTGEEGRPGAGLYIKPGIKFTFGTASIEIFDKINKLGAANKENFEGDTYSPITNQLQIDFNWAF